ncbi:hypothetical protein MSAN_01958200 [Mycena sanguinolenta]|uniref:Uncharacterized protein n=1 Tax=Mycena sanguinolenta TaxID=230812 RepID=A0A8H6XMH5_9AGAR|nr:hypothetical protein MSAN_01958200 [Mycena sanguinolenta]
MSETPVFNASSTLYRYVVIGGLSMVVFIGAMLFWRSRVIERRLALYGPVISVANKASERPRLYDMYLDGHGQLWHEQMPLSAHQLTPTVFKPGKNASRGMDCLISSQLTLALFIAMPFLDARPQKSSSDQTDAESGYALPEKNVPLTMTILLDRLYVLLSLMKLRRMNFLRFLRRRF